MEAIRNPMRHDRKVGMIVECHKKIGNVVKTGDIIASIEVDKDIIKIVTHIDGTILQIFGKGEKIPPNGCIAIIRNSEESIFLNPTNEYLLPLEKNNLPKELDIYLINLKEDGDYVYKGEILFQLSYVEPGTVKRIDEKLKWDSNNITMTWKYIYDFAGRDGFIDIYDSCEENILALYLHTENEFREKEVNLVDDNNMSYFIHGNDEDRINRKFANKSVITIDPFTKRKTITWDSLSGWTKFIVSPSINKKVFLSFTFNNIDGKDYIVFQTNPVELTLSKDDVVSFLFENDQIIEFKLLNEPYKQFEIYKNQLGSVSKVLITDDELMLFQNTNFRNWKITLNKNNHSIIGGEVGFVRYFSKRNLITVIKNLAYQYRELVRTEIDNYQPLYNQIMQIDSKSNISEECHVYLMIDYTNNHHKIGISNNPDFREKTLQSEKPTIELIAAKKFINRKIASSFEKALHNTYAEKRIRGEWFQLDAIELNEVKITLQN